MSDLYRSAVGRQRVRSWCTDRLAAWPVPHESELVPTTLGATHVVRAGSGPDTVVYLPGTNFNAATDLDLLSRLAAGGSVLAVDLPGQPGLSAPQRTQDDPRIHRGWLSEVLSALPAPAQGRVTLLGHSRGAYVALCADPARMGGLVLVNPAGFTRVSMSVAVMRTALPWVLRPTEDRSRALLQLMSGSRVHVDPDLVTWLTLVATDCRTGGAPGPVPRWCADRWRSHPVRVVSGRDDCFFPPRRLARSVHDRLGIDVELLESVGHLGVLQAPGTVADRALGLPHLP